MEGRVVTATAATDITCEAPEFTDISRNKIYIVQFNTVGVGADDGYEYGNSNAATDPMWYYMEAEQVVQNAAAVTANDVRHFFVAPANYQSAIAKRINQTASTMSMIDFEFEPRVAVTGGLKSASTNTGEMVIEFDIGAFVGDDFDFTTLSSTT
jgi:hypothetical protein